MNVIVGTAGHIDHGKTALVKAMTGIDADRLPEEKRRGITVDLGFAEMSVGEAHFGFVDVPGHERFVKNMLAGASGIDLVILVIAANEGVMPQTREHFDICRLLGIKNGIIALTKIDLVDAETIELAKLDVADLVASSFLENAPVLPVSTKTGDGIDRLRESLVEISDKLPGRGDKFVARLPIDRSFSMKGFGAVVTGTLASDVIDEGSEMELLPTGHKVRVRGLQTHGRAAKSVKAGQRVAVNLGGINHLDIERGMTLVEPGTLRLTQIIDAEIEVLADITKPLRSRQRVRVHIGTAEELARIQILSETGEIASGKKGFAQIRLENPILAISGERFIVRSYSPSATIAGGEVIDSLAAKHRRKEFVEITKKLSELHNAGENDAEKVMQILKCLGRSAANFADLQARTGLRNEILRAAIDAGIRSGSIIDADGRYINPADFDALLAFTEKTIANFHKSEPLSKGMPRQALRERIFAFLPDEIFPAAVAAMETVGKIVSDKDTIRLASYKTEFSAAEIVLNEKIPTLFAKAGLVVPKLDDALADAVSDTKFTTQEARKFFQRFLDADEIVKVTDDFYFSRDAIDQVIAKVQKYADGTTDRLIDVPQFKEIAGVSRKYAIPLLEYFDRSKITLRAGDKRIIL